MKRNFGVVLAGLPAATREKGNEQLDRFLQSSGFNGPVIDYRRLVGEFASASAVAAVLGVALYNAGEVPAALAGKDAVNLEGKGVLIMGLGHHMTALCIGSEKGSL